ncbi:MAG: XRE family transcriptional regulator [Flavobacterium sp.]|nr:MAG: XRE family transcriptional regulator [Flavobacterium sp.]
MRSKILQDILNETPKEVEIFVDKYTGLVLRINTILKEKGYTQAKLAEKLGKRPSEIHKWLSGDHNFTLRSVAKLEAELGEMLLEVPHRKPVVEPYGHFTKKTVTFTIHRNTEEVKNKDWFHPKTKTIANGGY